MRAIVHAFEVGQRVGSRVVVAGPEVRQRRTAMGMRKDAYFLLRCDCGNETWCVRNAIACTGMCLQCAAKRARPRQKQVAA
jgi:hypothetical protein